MLKLLSWFLIVALIPLTVVSVISYRTAKESLRQNAIDSVASNVESRVAFITNWFRYRLIDLESQATSIQNMQFLQALHDAYKSSNKSSDEFIKSYKWRSLASDWGQDLLTFHRLYGYHDVFLIDIEGNILFTISEESDLGSNLLDGPYAQTLFASAYRKAIETGRPVFSDLEHYSPSNNKIAGFLLEVIVNEDGDKIGAFAIQITPEQIDHTMLVGVETDTTVKAYVIGAAFDTNGVTLRSTINVNEKNGSAALHDNSIQDDSWNFLNHKVDTEQTRLWLNEHGLQGVEFTSMTEGVFDYDGPNGVRVLGIHKDVTFAGINWGLIAEIPESAAFAPAAHLKNLMIALVLITGLMVVVIATIITKRIVTPISRLSNVAKLVSQGDLSKRIHMASNDEIGELADSFNVMVSNLNKLFGDLSTLRYALDEHAIVSITDIRGKIIFANDKFCKLSGYDREELIGQDYRKIESGEHPPEFFRYLWTTLSKGKVWSGEIKNLAKNGTHYWVDATFVPFKGLDGKIRQYIAIGTDITLVKEAEKTAKRAATELEQTNLELEGQREEAIAMNDELSTLNITLETARVEATLATKAKSDFLANMSHEIRTPMTAILGFSDNLREGNLTEAEEHDAIETIHKNGEYLLTIINDILDMSKIEAGKMEVEHIVCSVFDVITDVADLMKVRADSKNIAFNTEIIGQMPETILSDPTRLKQVLINIIGNAIKFTDEGGVRLIARFVPQAENVPGENVTEPHIQFDIIDSGVGLTETQVGNLFQAFSQADTTMTRKFGGTGLGLTISKTFAEMLGGDIVIVDSQPGFGTRFRTTIATGSLECVNMVEHSLSTMTPKNPLTSIAPQPDALQNCRILLAEDGPDNQRLISFVLKKVGAEVTVAENGQIAFDLAMTAQSEGKPFDVILMDMQMPVLDGYKATMALRNKCYDGPIIALTAHAMNTDRERCINSGCDEFATKPINRQHLIELIQKHISPVQAPLSTTKPLSVNA